MPRSFAGTGVNAEVGGVTAALEDQSEYIKGRMPLFIVGVVGLSFLLLLVAFHSPLISLKAAIMNLLSVGAAYGVMTMVAQGGALGQLIGIDHEVPIAPFMPVMMFAILFGLSMDYEVFLISRIREEYLKDGERPQGGRRRPREDRARDHGGGGDHGRRVPRLPGGAGRVPEAVRDRARVGDLPRRHARADGAGARRDAAARRPQLVDPGLARADPARLDVEPAAARA